MRLRFPASLFSLLLLAACVPGPSGPSRTPPAPLTGAERAFTEEFAALKARHGPKAARFVLADVGGVAPAPRGFTQPVFECSFDEFGLVMGCERVDEQ